MIGGTVLPILTRRWHNHQLDDYKRAWKKIFDATSLLTWPLVAGGFILATPIMILVGGEEFLSSGLILKILIFAVGGIFFSALFSYTMISFGQQRRLIKPYVFVAVSSLLLYLVFIPRYSYYAAALITLYSEIAMGLVIWWLVRRTVNLKINLSIFFKALVASIIMALAVYYLPFDNLTVWGISLTVSSGVVIYVLALWILRAINLSAIKSLSNWRN
jgi:O-antigen/teichoic acid export membrane protein